MKCPHCNKQITNLDTAKVWLESYGINRSALVSTDCCEKGVTLLARITYFIKAADTNQTNDDWGKPIKK